jgi:hypothetical protein
MVRSFAAVIPFVCAVAGAAHAGPKVSDVRLEPRADGVAVVVAANEPLTFQSWTTPGAVIVDLLETEAAVATRGGQGPLTAVEISRHDVRGIPMSRLTLKTSSPQDYTVSAVGNAVTIAVFGKGTKALDAAALIATRPAPVRVATNTAGRVVDGELGRATAPAVASDAVYLAQAGGARQMTYIGFKNNAAQSRVFVRLNDSAEFTVTKQGDNLVVLELKNTTIPLRNNKNHLDTTFFDSPVKMITPSEIEDASPTVRVVIEMKTAVPFETKVEGREIAIYFKR